MKEAVITDTEGFYTGVTIVEDHISGVMPLMVDDILIGYQIAERAQEGFYLPRWDVEAGVWIEGKTQAELDEIISYTPPITDAERIAQLEAENASLLAETVRLARRDSQMQDDQMFILEALIAAEII